MKICRVSISYPTSLFPGAGLVCYYLSNYNNENNLLVTLKREGEVKESLSAKLKLCFINSQINKSSEKLNKRIHKNKNFFTSRLIIYFSLLFRRKGFGFFFKSIIPIIRYNPDIIACHSNLTILQGVFFKLFFRTKFVLHIHAMSDAIAINNLNLLRFFVKRAEKIYCISDPVRNELLKNFLPSKLKLTSTGVCPSTFYNSKEVRKDQIIIVGQLMWYKGHKYMVHAMQSIIEKYSNYKLLIIGDGEDKENLKKMVKENNLKDSVEFIPTLTHDQLLRVYNESKLLCMPSLYEGLPKVLLEAFACGLPAVITEACNASDISKNRAEVVQIKSSDQLAKAVLKFLDDEIMWKHYSDECLSIIDTHNWKLISEKIHQDYKSIIK